MAAIGAALIGWYGCAMLFYPQGDLSGRSANAKLIKTPLFSAYFSQKVIHGCPIAESFLRDAAASARFRSHLSVTWPRQGFCGVVAP